MIKFEADDALVRSSPDQKLIPYKLKFRVQEFADVVDEFVEENRQITALKQINPSGECVCKLK